MSVQLPQTVAEIMTRDVVSFEETASLLDIRTAIEGMRFRHVPVTAEGVLVGLVTERDLLRLAPSSLIPRSREQTQRIERQLRVSDVMIRDVLTASREMSLAEAGRLMRSARIDCLPVVDADGALIGIVTASDFVDVVIAAAAGPRL